MSSRLQAFGFFPLQKCINTVLDVSFLGEFLGAPVAFNLPPLYDLLLLIILLAIGIAIIVIIAKLLLFILPAAIVALVVWWLTGGSLFWAGVAFLVVAFISLIRR
jgi:hypothetical protein